MNKFITSDLHFWHKNILKFSKDNRPFSDIEVMNSYLIDHWNDTVKENDTVYHLGDFSFAGKQKTRDILDRLNGKKVFILGNHCYHMASLYGEYGEVIMYKEIKHYGAKVCLFHYPIAAWNGQGRGSVMLHGHCHGSYQGKGRTLDVGYCKHGRILSIDEAVEWCLNRDIEVVDHHKLII